MNELKNFEISRQDFVDGVIFELIQSVNPTKQQIVWDIEMIGDVRDTLEDWIVARLKLCTEKEFYPFIEEQDGN